MMVRTIYQLATQNVPVAATLAIIVLLVLWKIFGAKPQPEVRSSLTEEQKRANHKTIRGIICEAIIPIADVLGIKPPLDLSELNPPTGALFYDQLGGVVYCLSLFIKNGFTMQEIDAQLIEQTLINRLMQMQNDGKLPIIASNGVIEGDSAIIECPIKIENVRVFAHNVIIEAKIITSV
jgi:hypothetical protein